MLSPEERDLIEKINKAPGTKFQQRYAKLRAKVRRGTLTDEEYAELKQAIDISEQYMVDRLEALIELAHLRNVSLDQVMADLKIVPPPVR